MEDRLLTVEGVMERLSVSRSTVYRLMDRGELASIAITPRMRRIRASVVEEFITRQARDKEAPHPS